MDRPLVLARRAVAASLLAAFSGSTTSFAQEVVPPKDLPPNREAKDRSGDEVFLASDGKPATAGRVPEGTPEDAAELWARLVRSLTIDDGDLATEAPRAFELDFDVRNRSEAGTQNFLARFSYLDVGPGLVRGEIRDDSGRERSTQMRGLLPNKRLEYSYRKVRGEGKTEGWERLTRRDFPEDRAQIDSWAAISYDIARITRPNSFAIVALREWKVDARDDDAEPLPAGLLRFVGDPGVQLPATDVEGVRGGRRQMVSELCSGLRWLELQTPNFRDFRKGVLEGRARKGADPSDSIVYRLVFGIDPKTDRPQVVLVAPGKDGPLQVPGTILVQCTEWFLNPPEGAPEEQSWLPGRFFAYETIEAPREAPTPLRFSDVPTTDLYMRGGSMQADLSPEDFLPN